MKRLLIFISAALLLLSCEKQQKYTSWVPNNGSTVYGYVKSAAGGIANVVVSDGKEVTLTDSEGRYSLKSDKSFGSIFISVPSGYETVPDGVLPRFFARCKKNANEQEELDFQLRPVDQSKYVMLAFGDMHLADRKFCDDLGQFRKFAKEVNGFVGNSPVPVYALTLGDMSWDAYWKDNGFGLPEYISEIQEDFSGFQIFHTMGNHDNNPGVPGDLEAAKTYEETLCPNHYSFNVGAVHYIVLDDVLFKNEEIGTRDFWSEVTDTQLSWLKKDLAYVDKSTPVVVAMHTPLYKRDGSSSLYNLSDFINCFRGFDYVQVLSAHTHSAYNVDMLSRSIHIYENNNATVCGSLWMTDTACESGMNLCYDGAPGGYRIMDIDGKDIKWRYKATSLPDDFQFRTYDRNSFCLDESWVSKASAADKKAFAESVGDYAKKSSANEVLINIWDYDPSWTISVTEDGRQLEVTQVKNTKDPLYLAVYEAYEYQHGYEVNYSSGETDHIFKVKASSAASTLQIEITDRFGRSYSKTMIRPEAFYTPVK